MAVVVSNGNTTLATGSGFYRAEAYNLGSFSTTFLALSTTRTISVTFANTGNCQGVILCLKGSNSTPSNMKSVTVDLQENTGSWVTRATVTMTYAEILPQVSDNAAGHFWVPFNFGTPYAVTTASSTWRFQISQTGASPISWSAATSDASNISYVTWCDNAVSFTTGDVVVCKDVVTIDQTATLTGVKGTGDTTRPVSAILCRHPSAGGLSSGMLIWENAPASSYTLTVAGIISISGHSIFQAGTSASRIPIAQQALITFTSGGTDFAGFNGCCFTDTSSEDYTCGLALYGEVPTMRVTTLNGDAASGQKNLTTDDDTDAAGWIVGDILYITKSDEATCTDFSVTNTIASISGTSITMTSNLSKTKKDGGHVINLSRNHGIKVTGVAMDLAISLNTLRQPDVFVLDGVTSINMRYQLARSAVGAFTNDSANKVKFAVNDVTAYSTDGGTEFGMFIINLASVPYYGIEILRTYAVGHSTISSNTGQTSAVFAAGGRVTQQDCIVAATTMATTGFVNDGGTYTGNYFYNNTAATTSRQMAQVKGASITFQNNYFWGNGSLSAAVDLYGCVDPTWSGNTFNKCGMALQFFIGSNLTPNAPCTNDVFGNESSNTIDIGFTSGAFFSWEFNSPTGTLTVDTTNIQDTVDGSIMRVSNYNDSAVDNRCWLKYGYFQSTGTGLSDTTVRTSGGYALRIQPSHATNKVNWPNSAADRAVPTGNIQNYPMTVLVWIYINNTAYDAGTYTLPTLNVKYDNTTTVTSVATATFGSWQLLSKTFTPTTTYGQIEVWISGATDATTSNAYFYIDDMQIQYPSGVSLDLGGLDLFARATPVWPPIATTPLAGSVWDEATSAHTTSGTFGKFVQKLLSVAKFLALK